jgi:thiamine transport system ATP-binding protein
MLEVRNVSVRFGELLAVHDVDLEVGSGEVVALMGPSGCGKSTLLRVVAGLQAADTGSVRWDGRDLSDMPPHRRGIGLMFQDYALFPHLDVAGNVGFGLRMADVSRAESTRRVDEVLALVGLDGYQERPIAELSGGEQQRVALARTIAPEPKLVMLDEPIGALDRTLRDRLIVEMGDVFSSLGIGVLYVTHDQQEAFAVADRIAVMKAGELVQVASPENLWSSPVSAFVARFIGLENVYSGTATPDGLDLGWANLPWPDATGGVQIVIPPEAVTIDPDGPIAATVVSATYRGGVYEIRAASANAAIHLTSRRRLQVGDHVDLMVDVDQIVRLPA